MQIHGMRVISVLLLTAALLASSVQAEVSVTLTINGDMDEIMAILQLLRSMGYGGGAPEDDPLRLRVHSMHGTEDALATPAPEAPAQEPAATPVEAAVETPVAPPPPIIALQNPVAEPATAAPGGLVAVRVEVVDEQNAIDTLTASVGRINQTIDLYDNGENGDASAGDGIWSGSLTLPADARPGTCEIVVMAYDMNGDPIKTLTADQRVTNLSAKTSLTVLK